jgi:uncharacterized protein (TIGR00251 family)
MDSTKSPLPPYLRQEAEALILSVKVQPRASKKSIEPPLGNELRIKVTAPPVDSAANEAVIHFLSEVLGIPRNRIELLRGHTSRHKQLRIYGLTVAALFTSLNTEH